MRGIQRDRGGTLRVLSWFSMDPREGPHDHLVSVGKGGDFR
jgi:hypothetical protein